MLSSTRSSYTLSILVHVGALICLLFWNAHSHINKPKTLLVQTVKVREFQPVAVKPKLKQVEPKKIEPEPLPEPVIALTEPVEVTPQVESPKVEEAPIEEPQPEEKKPEPTPEPKSSSKKQPNSEKKAEPKKPKASPKPKTTAPKKESAPKKNTEVNKASEKKKQAEAAALKEKQQNIQAALDSLNKASSKSKALVAVATEQISSVKQVGALESEHLQTISCEGVQAYASKEAHYVSELIRRLKLALTLPEYGEVRVKMTLSRSGSITQLSVLKSSSAMNKKLVEQKLKGLTFAAFGASFAGEDSHTFTLILSNEA